MALLCCPGVLILEASKGSILIRLLLSVYAHSLYDLIPSHSYMLSMSVLSNELQYKLQI